MKRYSTCSFSKSTKTIIMEIIIKLFKFCLNYYQYAEASTQLFYFNNLLRKLVYTRDRNWLCNSLVNKYPLKYLPPLFSLAESTFKSYIVEKIYFQNCQIIGNVYTPNDLVAYRIWMFFTNYYTCDLTVIAKSIDYSKRCSSNDITEFHFLNPRSLHSIVRIQFPIIHMRKMYINIMSLHIYKHHPL